MKVMGIYESFQQSDSDPPTTEQQFRQGKSLEEGISGCLYVDTTYENREAVMGQVQSPRSQRGK